jgi:hypothetical protein
MYVTNIYESINGSITMNSCDLSYFTRESEGRSQRFTVKIDWSRKMSWSRVICIDKIYESFFPLIIPINRDFCELNLTWVKYVSEFVGLRLLQEICKMLILKDLILTIIYFEIFHFNDFLDNISPSMFPIFGNFKIMEY